MQPKSSKYKTNSGLRIIVRAHIQMRRRVVQKLGKNILVISLLCAIVLSAFALGARKTAATSRKTYKYESVGTDAVQSALDQRAAEGWRLTAVSAYSHPAGSANVERVVLVFEKE
jgi:hypothetical protein